MNAKAETPEEALELGFSYYQDGNDEWRWHYVSPHNRNILAVSSEGYENEEDCKDALKAVQLAGAVAISETLPPPEPLKMAVGRIGPQLPDPLPGIAQASLTVKNALGNRRIAEENLLHGKDEQSQRYVREYIAATAELHLACSVVEAILEPVDELEPAEPAA